MLESSTDPDDIQSRAQAESIQNACSTVPQGDSVAYGIEPIRVICQNCQADVITGTCLKAGKCAILASLGICLTGIGLLGFFIIPCTKASFKDTLHECPNCGFQVGRYKRL